MEIYTPKSFSEVSESEFSKLMGNLNIQRDAFCGGEVYYVPKYHSTGHRARVGIHTTEGKWYVDSDFFPKSP